MRLHLLLCALAALVLLAGCGGRTLDRSDPPAPPPAVSSSVPSASDSTPSDAELPPPQFDDTSFTLSEALLESDGCTARYPKPSATGALGESAEAVADRIEAVLTALAGQFDLSADDAQLLVDGRVTRNEDNRFSVRFDGSYNSSAEAHPVAFCFGLSFFMQSGRQLELSDIVAPNTLAALLLDAQSTELLGRDPDILSAQRTHLDDLGLSGLAERLVDAQAQDSVDKLLDLSFYLEKGRLTVTVAVPHAIGDVALLTLDNANA